MDTRPRVFHKYGADNQIRTDDLVITNDVLYLLSYISILPRLRLAYYTIVRRVCQGHF